ncbi:MAG: class I fructose-bisphosphate aldolase [Candidatus Poribacteria bacterium]
MERKFKCFEDLNLRGGKRERLHRLLYESGTKNGTLFFLPVDQGFEHGPRDFNEANIDPDFQLEMAKECGYSGIVFHYGLAKKYWKNRYEQVNLVLKLNGKTEIPPEAFSPLVSTVKDAKDLGAIAVGYTLYVGSPAQDRDIRQLAEVRAESEKYEIPLIVWAYPRGEYVDRVGGRDTLYAIDYATRVACEVGADVLKLNWPFRISEKQQGDYTKSKGYKQRYEPWEEKSDLERIQKLVHTAGLAPVMFSGGEKKPVEEEIIEKARTCMDAGAIGMIIGRNAWGRETLDDAKDMAGKLYEILSDGKYRLQN